jgi:glucose-6-phosphate isomerase
MKLLKVKSEQHSLFIVSKTFTTQETLTSETY